MAVPVWTPLHAQLHQVLKQRQLLANGEKVLMAVSGGQDSLCLARLLLDLQPKWQWSLAIAHCDHRWRTDSAANALHVCALAQIWELPYFQQTATQIPGSEAAAREWRYQSLIEIAQQHGYGCIVTGHTASDRAETLLYNLIRGSGADGLQALTWRRPLSTTVGLVRPLLNFTRAQTAQFCHEKGLQIWEDSTNQTVTYARNRLRLDILPYLKTHFNPQVDLALAQTAELLQAEVEYLEQAATQLYRAAIATQPEGKSDNDRSKSVPTGFNRRILQGTHLALQRRVIRLILRQAMPHAPNFEQIEKLVTLLQAPNRTQTDPFPGGKIAYVEGDWIWFKE